MGDGLLEMTNKYGPYVDKIRPFFVTSLERRIYSVLEEFAYAENSPLAEHFPGLQRCLDIVAGWTDPLEAFCAKSKDESIAEEATRLAIKYIVKDCLIDGFVNSIVLNNRLNRISRELQAMGVELNFFTGKLQHQHGNRPLNRDNGKSLVKSTIEIARGPGDSDLEVEIGSVRLEESLESSSRKRARKRAATYDSPSNANIDRREPPESSSQRQLSEDRFRISEENLARRLAVLGNIEREIPRKTGNRGKGQRLRNNLSYDSRDSSNHWKNVKLSLRVRRCLVVGENYSCVSRKKRSVCRLTLPCKVDDLIAAIFRADPSLSETCLIVVKRKFVSGLKNVCSCLDDILGRICRQRIRELCLLCDIRSSYIAFKLGPRTAGKPFCLFAARVPVCRNVRKQRLTTSSRLSSIPNRTGNEEEEEEDVCRCNVAGKRLYSPCSNDSFANSSGTGIVKTEGKCQWFSAESDLSKPNNSKNYSETGEERKSSSSDETQREMNVDKNRLRKDHLPGDFESELYCECRENKEISSGGNLTGSEKDFRAFEESFPEENEREGNCCSMDHCKSTEIFQVFSSETDEERKSSSSDETQRAMNVDKNRLRKDHLPGDFESELYCECRENKEISSGCNLTGSEKDFRAFEESFSEENEREGNCCSMDHCKSTEIFQVFSSEMDEERKSSSSDETQRAMNVDKNRLRKDHLPGDFESELYCECRENKEISSGCNLTGSEKDFRAFEESFSEENEREGNCCSMDHCKSTEIFQDFSVNDKEKNGCLCLLSSGENLEEVMKYSKYPSLSSFTEKSKESRTECSCGKSPSCGELFQKTVDTDSFKNHINRATSPFAEGNENGAIVSGIGEILDSVVNHAENRFPAVRKNSAKLFSVSVQTREIFLSSKAVNVDLQIVNSASKELDVKKDFETSIITVEKNEETREEKLDPKESQSEINEFTGKCRISKNRKHFGDNVDETFFQETTMEIPRTFVSIEIQSNDEEFFIRPIQSFSSRANNFVKFADNKKTDKGCMTRNCTCKDDKEIRERQNFPSNLNDTTLSAKAAIVFQKTQVSSETQTSVKKFVQRWNKLSNSISESSVVSAERKTSSRNRKLQVSIGKSSGTRVNRDSRWKNDVSLRNNIFPRSPRCKTREKVYLENNRYRLVSGIYSRPLPRDRKCVDEGDRRSRTKGKRLSSDGGTIRGFSGNSIDCLKRLIRGKLCGMQLDRNKATNASKIFLKNDKYLVSVVKSKVSRPSYTSTFSAATKSHDDGTESLGSFYPSRGTTTESGMKNYRGSRDLRLLGGSEENPYNENPENFSISSEQNYSRSTTSLPIFCGKLDNRYRWNFLANGNVGSKGRAKIINYRRYCRAEKMDEPLKEVKCYSGEKIKGEFNDSRKGNYRIGEKMYYPNYESCRCYDKENYDCRMILTESSEPCDTKISSRAKFQRFPKFYFNCTKGREDSFFCGKYEIDNFAKRHCDKRMNDLNANFRKKLCEYVDFCRNVKYSILNKLRPDDIYEASVSSIPTTYANKCDTNRGEYFVSQG